MEYLASLGAVEAAHEGKDLRIPQLAPHHWQQLNTADASFQKPVLDRCLGPRGRGGAGVRLCRCTCRGTVGLGFDGLGKEGVVATRS